ncbi:SDR family NAD(P)-dependent oxidoreductase [Nocardioides sp. WS12]|uniref:SDR family NAD(P)-dependent oxidoreductase n=1 Tax=Nocardioides sp. WS12 TaxID=2486272 RepID=UPI0015FADE79|nr:SDR family NAD(P)-dependent oxidoreductase [Nocardioides sp. WS12]
MHIENTAAIVTGAASGLGAATAARLAELGARVTGFDLANALKNAPVIDGVRYHPVDVSDSHDVAAGVKAAANNGAPLRIVVNCAGIAPSMRVVGKNGAHDLDFYAKVIQVNLIGTFAVMAKAAEEIAKTPALDDGQRGVIINTASIAAFDGQVGQAAYASSKSGVVGLTLSCARDLAQHGIRVLAIAPGIIDSPMLATISEEFRAGLAAGVPFPQRLGQPEEYAQLAVALVEHNYLNGETIRMDGALRMAPR